MNVCSRLKEVVRANIQELNAPEPLDPLAAMAATIRALEQALAQLRRQLKDARAGVALLEHRLEQARQEHQRWQADAELALCRDNEELARQALQRKLAVGEFADSLDRHLREARQLVERLSADELLVAGRVEQARLEREGLIARRNVARVRQQAALHAARLDSFNISESKTNDLEAMPTVFDDLGEVDDRLAALEAVTRAARDLAGAAPDLAFQRLCRDIAINDELAALKQREG